MYIAINHLSSVNSAHWLYKWLIAEVKLRRLVLAT